MKVLGLIFGLILSLVFQIELIAGFQLFWSEIIPVRRDLAHFVEFVVDSFPGILIFALPFWLVYRGVSL